MSDVPVGEDGFDDDPLVEINRDHRNYAMLVREANDALRARMEGRRHAYTRVMQGKASKEDLAIFVADIKRFCRADESAYHENDRTHVLLTGRQEVWLRVKDFSTLTLDELMERYTTPYEGHTK